MVLQLIFKSFIHLEFIFVYAVSWSSSFIFLNLAVQISQHHMLKRQFLLHFMLLPPLTNIFSHTVGSLYNLVLFSLAMQKPFILMRSHLFILSFMTLALGVMSVRMFLRGMSEIFLPMFSSGSFMVLQLIFKSFIHLEFIFVYGVSW